MTSDIDSDEIQDSAFPVDFNDDKTTLDMYGVWVKSGPRDVTKQTINTSFSSDISKYDDISDLPDLTDFTDFTENEEQNDVSTENENIVFEEIADESPFSSERDSSIKSAETLDDASFDLINTDDFFDIHSTTVHNDETDLTDETALSNSDDEIEIVFEDIHSDELVSDQVLPTQRNEQSRVFEEVESFDLEDFQVDAFSTEEPTNSVAEDIVSPESIEFEENPAIEETKSEEVTIYDTNDIFTVDDIIIEKPDVFIEPENVAPKKVIIEKQRIFEDTELFEFDEPGDLPSDDDFSSFLNDMNSAPPHITTDAELDLDTFVDSFNESGGASHDSNAKVFDENEPVDIDLEFDESFIADSEKIKATGSAVSESEFFNSEFGVELVDETGSLEDETFESFDSIETSENPTNSGENSTFTSNYKMSEMEENDEFDDLLTSLDLSPTPSRAEPERTPISQKTYDLSITEEENYDFLTSSDTDMAHNANVDVSLFSTDTNLEEFLDIPDITGYTDTESDDSTPNFDTSSMEESVSLDFDDITAVEQELNDFTPDSGEETVTTNDKSTELLMRIADELSSIKHDLSTLKSELAGFKASGFIANPASMNTEEMNAENSGFFSDDDTDETIALTGDELNNILITADFTEEKNEEPDTAAIDDLDQSFIQEEKEVRTDESFENTTETSEIEIPETLPDSIFEIPDLEISLPVDVAHVNKIDEDVSYLEGSNSSEPTFEDIAIEEPELEIIDFDDEKLEEPELTEFNIDLADIENEFPLEQDLQISPESDVFSNQDSIDLPNIDEIELFEEQIEFDAPEHIIENLPDMEDLVLETDSVQESESVPSGIKSLPVDLKDEIKSVLSYMDQLLESLPADKIEEFARSEHFEVYKKLFEELGIS